MIRLILILWLFASAAHAVEPHEMLTDPVLEARAQALDAALRCVRCRSENIASSGADWAADARVLVRELISDGKTDQQVLDFFVDRYGEYVLMRPPARGGNLILWFAGPALLLIGLGTAAMYLRRQSRPAAPEGLSEEEQARLDHLMRN